MELYKKLLFCITWIVILYTVGILLFTKGFLLTRFVIRNNSSCMTDFVNGTNFDNPVAGACWMKPLRKKAVIIVIDALRFDFVAYSKQDDRSSPLPYENKLRVIQNLLETEPRNSRLFKFIADPPTTTLQRLKGLTTGSLPTFIDVASNFDSSAISEDNIIDQLVNQNKSIIFMGDDTWANLFPGRFKRSYPFPSFNVKDLHTVDNGVIKHLVPELQKTDWDVLIAHFLGVDHCGHRYGPYHPAMADKLQQMNDVLKSVIDVLDDDVVLFVLGDHGMTRTGDHGGDSKDELQAALFVYSPAALTESEQQDQLHYETIRQTDLVPTISLLLGTPIPFSNLGTIIVDLFNVSDDNENIMKRKIAAELHIIHALELNANQVRRFIQTYVSVSDEFSKSLMIDLENRFKSARSQMDSVVSELHERDSGKLLSKLHSVRDQYLLYLSLIRTMCQEVWAKFDLSLMLLGIVLTACSIWLSVYWLSLLTVDGTFQWQPIIVGCVGSFWVTSLIILLSTVQLSLLDTIISLIIIFGVIIIFGIIAAKLTMDKKQKITICWSSWQLEFIPILIVIVYCMSLFSNSYIVFEDAVSAFFLQSLITYTGSCIVCRLYDLPKISFQKAASRKYRSQSFDIIKRLTSPVSLTVVTVLLLNLLIRLAFTFRACREEQWTCEPSSWMLSLSSLTDEFHKYKNFRYFFSITCLACFPLFANKWLQYWGNLNGYLPSVLSMKYLFPTGAVAIGLYWALQALPSKVYDSLPVWQITLFPQVVYVAIIGMLASFFWNPLCLFLLPQSSQECLPISNPTSENILPQMYNHLKANWRKHLHSTSVGIELCSSTREAPPVVYGLATVFSASHLVFLSSVILLLFMLLGDNYSPSLTLQLIIMVLLLELNASLVQVTNNYAFHVPWSAIISWSLLASEHFYSTGHQTVLTTIHWQSAFHGFHGDFNYYFLPTSFIVANTFASYIITIISLPLLIYWPRIRRGIIFLFDKPRKETKASQGEFILYEQEDKFWNSIFQLLVGFLTIHSLKIMATMCCAMIHRRHLMVWKIFAPRFLFEGAVFLLLGPLSIIVYLLVVRVKQAIKSWIKLLER